MIFKISSSGDLITILLGYIIKSILEIGFHILDMTKGQAPDLKLGYPRYTLYSRILWLEFWMVDQYKISSL